MKVMLRYLGVFVLGGITLWGISRWHQHRLDRSRSEAASVSSTQYWRIVPEVDPISDDTAFVALEAKQFRDVPFQHRPEITDLMLVCAIDTQRVKVRAFLSVADSTLWGVDGVKYLFLRYHVSGHPGGSVQVEHVGESQVALSITDDSVVTKVRALIEEMLEGDSLIVGWQLSIPGSRKNPQAPRVPQMVNAPAVGYLEAPIDHKTVAAFLKACRWK